jgi:GTP-binding protein LepA
VKKPAEEIKKAFGFTDDEILYASGKTGEGVEKILEASSRTEFQLQKVMTDAPLRALIFDSAYDQHRGVVTFVRVVDGKLAKNEKILTLGTKTTADALEVGFFHPKYFPSKELQTGEVGYIVTGLRDVRKARVGDTISTTQSAEPLPGYKQVKPMVYASIFPTSGDDYPLLRDAIEKLKLSDAALDFEPEQYPCPRFRIPDGIFGFAAYGCRARTTDSRI